MSLNNIINMYSKPLNFSLRIFSLELLSSTMEEYAVGSVIINFEYNAVTKRMIKVFEDTLETRNVERSRNPSLKLFSYREACLSP